MELIKLQKMFFVIVASSILLSFAMLTSFGVFIFLLLDPTLSHYLALILGLFLSLLPYNLGLRLAFYFDFRDDYNDTDILIVRCLIILLTTIVFVSVMQNLSSSLIQGVFSYFNKKQRGFCSPLFFVMQFRFRRPARYLRQFLARLNYRHIQLVF